MHAMENMKVFAKIKDEIRKDSQAHERALSESDVLIALMAQRVVKLPHSTLGQIDIKDLRFLVCLKTGALYNTYHISQRPNGLE